MPNIVSRQEWLEARKALLDKEKAFDRSRDALAAERQALPWVKVDQDYVFDTADGAKSLRALFGDRTQLLVYHFMFGDDWSEGCPSCSFWADTFNGIAPHLAARDVSFVVTSTGPLDKLNAYKARMGWTFDWVSSGQSSFNHDYGVTFAKEGETASYNYREGEYKGELPGASAFIRDGDAVFHTYSTYARGLDMLNNAYHWLDMAPKGRDEKGLPWSMDWVRRHDVYGQDDEGR